MMGKVIIDKATSLNPIEIAGRMIGPCYNSSIDYPDKNYKRGLNAICAGHGRVLEYCDCYFVLEGYSARVLREFYTHLAGAPTRTQASTRYIDYRNYSYYTPHAIENNSQALDIYNACLDNMQQSYQRLREIGVSAEDAANILPLGMKSVVSVKMNARTLISMAEQRLCTRAYEEYRQLMHDLIAALTAYSPEWRFLANMMKCKCDVVGYCIEEKSCGKTPKK